jgi:hypothetical protein
MPWRRGHFGPRPDAEINILVPTCHLYVVLPTSTVFVLEC